MAKDRAEYLSCLNKQEAQYTREGRSTEALIECCQCPRVIWLQCPRYSVRARARKERDELEEMAIAQGL